MSVAYPLFLRSFAVIYQETQTTRCIKSRNDEEISGTDRRGHQRRERTEHLPRRGRALGQLSGGAGGHARGLGARPGPRHPVLQQPAAPAAGGPPQPRPPATGTAGGGVRRHGGDAKRRRPARAGRVDARRPPARRTDESMLLARPGQSALRPHPHAARRRGSTGRARRRRLAAAPVDSVVRRGRAPDVHGLRGGVRGRRVPHHRHVAQRLSCRRAGAIRTRRNARLRHRPQAGACGLLAPPPRAAHDSLGRHAN